MFSPALSARPFLRSLVALVCAAAIFVPACAGLRTDAELDQGAAKILAAKEKAMAESATHPPGSEEQRAAEAQAIALAAMAEELEAARRQITDAEAAAARELAAAQGVVSVAPVPGLGAIFGVLGSLTGAYGFLRSAKARRVASQIIDGFERAQVANPILAEQIQASADTIHAAMDTSTIAEVKRELTARRARRVPAATARIVRPIGRQAIARARRQNPTPKS
jgi:hypothetical protein